jgi:2-methylcitrate dehydratase PrpD
VAHLASAAPSSPTSELAAFAASLRFKDIPEAARLHAKLCVVDHLGCALFGSTLPWCRILQAQIAGEGATGRSTVYGTPLMTSPSLAALANGTAGHGFELDDLHHSGAIHPGSLTVPAAIALSEAVEERSGRDLLTAIVAGYEVGARIGMAMGAGHFARGFHPQGTVGVFASAATSGSILRLDKSRMAQSFGIAGSQASGLMAAQEGGMVKRLHSGNACRSGVNAAELASRGFTGIEGVLEADFGGFLSSMGGDRASLWKMTAGLGETWEVERVSFKAYASCAAAQTSIDCAGNLRDSHGLAPEQIDRVIAHVSTHAYVHCGWKYRPNEVTSAQMSIAFGVAAMLVDGEVSVNQFTDDKIRDPSLVAMAERVYVLPDRDLDALGHDLRHTAWMEIITIDGRRLMERVQHRTGSLERPLSLEALKVKFHGLAQAVPGIDTQALFDAVMQLEDLISVKLLADMLRPARG